jgi:hypothetical protein
MRTWGDVVFGAHSAPYGIAANASTSDTPEKGRISERVKTH